MQSLTKILFACIYLCLTLQSTAIAEETEISQDPEVIQIKEATSEGSQLSKKDSKEYLNRNISIEGDNFLLDGKPLRIMSGSVHYFRLPSEYWRDRLRKLKAAGLNAVSTYVEWSSHEPEDGVTLFDGDNDIARFISIAAEEGLLVLLRPGPYICAERDLGGFPYWLLSKYPNIKLRTSDTDFIAETKKWMATLFGEISNLLYGNGGPIILVQVENEYGSYGASKAYMGQIRDIIKEHVKTDALLYTTDGFYRSYFYDGSVSGALTTIDFGPTNSVVKTFKDLRAFMPVGPLMNSEYYPGWLTHWAEALQQVSADRVVFTLQDMLEHDINFNFYMFFGGTNFGFTAGANYGSFYQSDITSYDYDAPLSEAGDPTPKYYAIREVMKKYNLVPDDIPEPKPSAKGAYGQLTVTPHLKLLSAEGRSSLGIKYKDVTGAELPTFEALRQYSGLILYETMVNETDGLLEITKPRDRILVYVNNTFQGAINRMQKLYTLSIKCMPGSILSLLVENQGRVNYGSRLHDFKGILSPVNLNNKSLDGLWSVTGYPLNISMDSKSVLNNKTFNDSEVSHREGPTLYHGHLVLPQGTEPLDTFVDPTGWGKGYIFVNGHNLGRYWPGVGPQVTLYVPGVWLRAAPEVNTIEVLELQNAPESPILTFIDYPILNRTGILLDNMPR